MNQAKPADSLARRQEAHRLAVGALTAFGKGKATQSLTLIKRSIALDPNVATSHHDLGGILLKLGRFEEAIDAFRAAVRLDPAFASAHQFLGFALDNVGRRREAIVSYETALKLDPVRDEARRRLADLYMALGREADAAVIFHALAESTGSLGAARLYKARGWVADGRIDRALEIIRPLAESDEADGKLLFHFAWMLAHAGRIAEAETAFLRGAGAREAPPATWYGYASVHHFEAGDAPIIARMNAAMGQPRLPPLDCQLLHFALGKAYEDLGQFDLAIRNFEAANRLRARHTRFDEAALVRIVDRTIAATSRPAERKGVQDSTPVLIVGMPRSGTTLVEQILSSHPEVAGGGELGFWPDHDTPAADILNADEAQDQELGADYLATLRAISPAAERVTDKMPFNFGLLGIIHRVIPKATLIHCRRHPIDNCLSIFMTTFESTMAFACDRRSLVAYYRQYERLMDHWRAVLPADRFVEVQYEELVADPETHARRLVAACGLEWNDACLAPQRNRRTVKTASFWQARQPIYRSSVERWRRYEPWLGELRQLEPDALRK